MDGNQLSGNLANLNKVASIDYNEVDNLFSNVKISVLTDVTNPLIGQEGAAAIYGPQKGLAISEIHKVDAALTHWSSILLPDNHSYLLSETGLGAAGGVALPLYARYSFPIISGSDYFFDKLKIDSLIAESDLVITGEGSLDKQSFMGKIVGKVLASAKSKGKPCYAIAGVVSEINDSSISTFSLSEIAGSSINSMRDPERYLREAVSQILASYRSA